MKRKFRLITTIASLCFAVALMSFGVYAASTVSYSINSTVSYSFTDALIKVTRTVGTITLDVPPAQGADLSGLSYTNGAPASFQTYDINNKWTEPTIPGGFVSGAWNANAMTETLNFDFNVSYIYRVTVEIETKNTNGVTLTYTLPNVTGQNYRVAADTDNDASGSTINIGDSATIIYYVALIDQTIEITADNISSSFTLVKN